MFSHRLQQGRRSTIDVAMRYMLRLFLCMCLLLSPFWAMAQEAVQQSLEIGPSGTAYLKSIRNRSIEADVAYYDPNGAVPRLETSQVPEQVAPKSDPNLDPGALTTDRVVILGLATAVLIGLAVLVLRGAGSFTLSLQGDAQNPGRAKTAGRSKASTRPYIAADLAAILATSDRRLAMVMLAQTALTKTVAANGVLLQPSWTMRDALHHIPKGQAQLDALRSLVMLGERVLFGNRDVTEAEFQTQVTTIRHLLGVPSA